MPRKKATPINLSSAQLANRAAYAFEELAKHRKNRFIIIGELQRLGHSKEDSTRACDLLMGYNAHYNQLEYRR